MTDGPYAPPSMGRQWNAFARTIALAAFEEECRPRFRDAVCSDARRQQVDEAAEFLRRRLPEKPQQNLFGVLPIDAFAAAREAFPSQMAQTMITGAEAAIMDGSDRDAAIDEGVAASLREDGRDHCNSIEAHLLNEEGAQVADSAHDKCETLLQAEHWNVLAKRVQGKATGDDEGAPEVDRLGSGPPL